jgi:hypothetical protein
VWCFFNCSDSVVFLNCSDSVVSIKKTPHCRNNSKNTTLSEQLKKHHTVRTIQKTNIKIVERVKIKSPNTKTHDCSLFWLGTCVLVLVPSQESEQSCVLVLVPSQESERLGTNTKTHDRSLSWLGHMTAHFPDLILTLKHMTAHFSGHVF